MMVSTKSLGHFYTSAVSIELAHKTNLDIKPNKAKKNDNDLINCIKSNVCMNNLDYFCSGKHTVMIIQGGLKKSLLCDLRGKVLVKF